jgi:preprotein translocase subunit SecE
LSKEAAVNSAVYYHRELVMNKMKAFFLESYGELKKVVWPGRESVASSTRVVLVSTALFAVFFGVVDFVLLKGLFFIF